MMATATYACSYCQDSGLHLAREPEGGKLIVLGDCPACVPAAPTHAPGPAVDGSGLFYASYQPHWPNT